MFAVKVNIVEKNVLCVNFLATRTPISQVSSHLKALTCRLGLPAFIISAMAGCMYSPGLKVDNLPVVASESTDLKKGIHYELVSLNSDNIPKDIEAEKIAVKNELPRFIPGNYLLGQGDVLQIYLWDNPDLTAMTANSFIVNQDGNIMFPMVNSLKASGKTISELKIELTKRLSKYIRSPNVQISISKYNSKKIYINGEVKAPGEYILTDQNLSLIGALSAAGGQLNSADTNEIILYRKGQKYPISLKMIQDNNIDLNKIYMMPNDAIYVNNKETRKIYILGEAGSPAPIQIPELGLSLASAIGEGKGLNPYSANSSKIYVLRQNEKPESLKIYLLDLSHLENFALANRFQMKKGDIIYIDPTGLTRWNRVLNLLLPNASAFRTAQTITTSN